MLKPKQYVTHIYKLEVREMHYKGYVRLGHCLDNMDLRACMCLREGKCLLLIGYCT